MKSRVAVVCASPLVALFAVNCSVPSFCEGSECGAADGGGDGDVIVGPHDASSDGPVADGSKLPDAAMGDGATEAGPPVCDKSADPKDSPACVVDGDGIFVDAAGLDTNAGTKEAPVQTITKAVALAQGGVGRVYVCAGGYAETVSLTAAVSVYGGFACGTYAYSGVLPVVTAAAGKSALSIAGVTGVTVEDMQFVSVDATGTDASGNGNSSIAAFISSSTGVTIKRSTFKAGAGAAAAAGATTGTVYTTPAQVGSKGTASAGGAALGPFTCANNSGKTSSGKGGDPSSGGSGGTMGSSDPIPSPVFPTGSDGAPGSSANCNTAGPHNGSSGLGGGGGSAATSAGTLTASAWQPSTGGAGDVGGVGEGGGGGGSTDTSGGGGSGSLGGCGGDAGQGGAGGGGSLGLAVYQSSVTLVTSTIEASAGGGGGSGSKGGTGQNVSLGGAPGSSAACNGAVGGLGGSGGGGAGGSGGVSAGIVWTGSAPTVNGTVTNNAASLAGITVASTPSPGGGPGAAGDPATSAARGGEVGAMGLTGSVQAVLGI